MSSGELLSSEEFADALRDRLLPAVATTVEGERNQIGYRSAINRLLQLWSAWPGRGAWDDSVFDDPDGAWAVLDEFEHLMHDEEYEPAAAMSPATRRSYLRRLRTIVRAVWPTATQPQQATPGSPAGAAGIDEAVAHVAALRAERDAGNLTESEFKRRVAAALSS